MSERDKRVLLVKPGDLLLIGNVGDIEPETVAEAVKFFNTLGIKVGIFPEDIDIDVIEREEWRP